MSETARTAVVTVSYDSIAVMAPFLDSVPAATSSAVPVLVADNKPDAASRPALEELLAQNSAGYLPMVANLGYGHAVNAAVETLGAEIEYVLVSNPDVVLGPDSLDILVSVLDADIDQTIAAVGPRIVELDGSTYPSARSVPSLRTGVGHAVFARIWPSNPWTRSYRQQGPEAVVRRDAGWLSGACLLVRRTAFTEVGGFDTDYFMYFEDVDLGYRFGLAGRRNVYEPSAEVLHTGAHSTTTESGRMLDAHHESARRFLRRRYPGPLLAPVRGVLSIGLRVRAALARRRAPKS